MSDPSPGVAHPIFFPAGRLDPVVTLTRDIAMYRIGPFPRPQFSKGPWPQLLPLRGPSSRVRGAISFSNRPRGQQGAARSRRFERNATTRRSRSEQPERYHHHRYPHNVERLGIEKSNRTTGHPVTQRPDRAQRPDQFRFRDDGPPRLPRLPRPAQPTHRVPMSNRAAPPSRPPTTRTAAVTAEQQSTSARRTPNDPSGRAAEPPRPAGQQQLPCIGGTEPRNRDRDDVDDEERRFASGLTGNTHNANAHPATGPQRGETSTTRSAARHPRDEPLQERTSSRTFVHSADDGNRGG